MGAATDLRQRILGKMSTGLLPTEPPLKSYAGFGSGYACDACAELIIRSQVEHELDYGGTRTFRLHAACEAVWRALRGQA